MNNEPKVYLDQQYHITVVFKYLEKNIHKAARPTILYTRVSHFLFIKESSIGKYFLRKFTKCFTKYDTPKIIYLCGRTSLVSLTI